MVPPRLVVDVCPLNPKAFTTENVFYAGTTVDTST